MFLCVYVCCLCLIVVFDFLGEAMQLASDLRKGGMVAITGVDEATILQMCRDVTTQANSTVTTSKGSNGSSGPEPYLAIGNYLGPRNFAVSGDKEACLALQSSALMKDGVKVSRMLAVSGAFHSPLMLPARQALSAALDKVSLTPTNMTCPVYSNVTGDTYYYYNTSEEKIKTALLDQLVKPVRWDKSMHLLLSNPSFQRAYEIGPGTVCSGIVKMFNRRANVTSVKL
jgi:[acyl-carrier-protein] S-malonyltransferase